MLVHEIETARLRLRPLRPPAASALHRLWTHPEVRRFLWDDEVIPVEQTASIIETSTRLFNERGFGLWGVTVRGAHDLSGFGGYWFFRGPPERELLYGIAADQWGRGFATEVARALLRYGFQELQFTEVQGSTDAPNVASMRVMQKAGMLFHRRAATSRLDTIYYRLSRDEFREDHAPYFLRALTTEL